MSFLFCYNFDWKAENKSMNFVGLLLPKHYMMMSSVYWTNFEFTIKLPVSLQIHNHLVRLFFIIQGGSTRYK